jgi:dihydrofolate reductase
MITLVAAMSLNRAIGNNGVIPWRFPRDMLRFRDLTIGKTVVMGRKTYESLPSRYRPLPNRRNLIITRQQLTFPGAEVLGNWEQVLELSKNTDVMICGGEEIYRLALPDADKIILTVVQQEFSGDSFFPDIDEKEWDLEFSEIEPPDEKNPFVSTYEVYTRRK